jgi:hypothetical protein
MLVMPGKQRPLPVYMCALLYLSMCTEHVVKLYSTLDWSLQLIMGNEQFLVVFKSFFLLRPPIVNSSGGRWREGEGLTLVDKRK